MKKHFYVGLGMAALTLAPALVISSPSVTKYSFVKIADNYSPGTPFVDIDKDNNGAAINDNGEVVFQANTAVNGFGIFVASHSKIRKIADSTQGFTNFYGISINSDRSVVFNASKGDLNGVFKSFDRFITTIADTNSAFFSDFIGPNLLNNSPAINDSQSVAFVASLKSDICPTEPAFLADNLNHCAGLFVEKNGKMRIIADDTRGSFVRFLGGAWPAQVTPKINNGGQVAFWAHSKEILSNELSAPICALDDIACKNVMGIYKTSPRGFVTVADNKGQYLSFFGAVDINDPGSVVYVWRKRADLDCASGSSRWRGVNIYRNGVTSKLADNQSCEEGAYSRFGAPNVNNKGDTAFLAVLRPGDNPSAPNSPIGIFTGPNPTTDSVIKVGDKLAGKTVGALEGQQSVLNFGFNQKGINNKGQIVFIVGFTDGTKALYLAIPSQHR
jgi:hypothetical protein